MHFVKWQACGNDFVFINGFVEDVDTISKKQLRSVTAILVSVQMALSLSFHQKRLILR